MYISRILIRNFRNFKNVDLSLTEPICVIVGSNRVGKSNLIHAIRLVLDPNLSTQARMLTPSDFWDGLKPLKGNEEIVISVELREHVVTKNGDGINTGDNDKDSKLWMLSPFVNKPGEPRTARLTYLFRQKTTFQAGNQEKLTGLEDAPSSEEPIVEASPEYGFLWYKGADSVKPRANVTSDDLQSFYFAFLNALRDTEDLLSTWSRSPLKPMLENLDLKDALDKAAIGVREGAKDLFDRSDIKELSSSIDRRSKDMAGDIFEVKPKLHFVSQDTEELLRSIKLLIDGDNDRSISYASLGMLNVLYLSLLMERANRDNKRQQKGQKKLEKGTIIALEEPEAHVHPHVQRSIFRHFRSENAALLVTTHSPHIASVANLKSIVVIRDQGGEGSQAFTLQPLVSEKKLTSRELADLQRYMDVTRAELIFARGVILVEGIADLYAVHALASGTDHSSKLDKLGISVIAIHSTDFAPFVKLLSRKGFNIPFVVITDGDRNASNVSVGIRRGINLVQKILAEEGEYPELLDAWRNDDKDRAIELLKNWNIFVGNQTLEIDLLKDHSAEIQQVYELMIRKKSLRTEFKSISVLANSGDIKHQKLFIKKIMSTKIGKGRFAQKLAPKLRPSDAPSYIKEAIERIIALVS